VNNQLSQQATVPIGIDPNNIPDAYANGPINLSIRGPCGTLTFTNVRGDIAQLLAGQSSAKTYAVVTARVTLPLEALTELRNMLNQSLAS
jgi:hypothetical protein